MDLSQIDSIILDIDNENDILQYQLPNGLALWMLTRYTVYTLLLRKAISQYHGEQLQNASPASGSGKLQMLKMYSKTFQRNPLNEKAKFDFLNICSTLSCVPGKNGYTNRITGFLNDLPPYTNLNLIKAAHGVYRDRYEGHYRFYDYIILKERIRKKMGWNKKSDAKGRDVIAAFLNIIQRKLHGSLDAAQMSGLTSMLNNAGEMAPGLESSIKTILQNTRPALVLIEDGNYGNLDTCTITSVARTMNIKTAEMQHGVFDIGFKYSDKLIVNPDFARHKTDYLLTFGDYFSNYAHSSSQSVSIGSHFLESKVSKIQPQQKSREFATILFITQRDYTDNLIPVIYEALLQIKKPFRLVIRLHPSDSTVHNKYATLQQFDDTRFSQTEDLYEMIAHADYIIGSYSTALFESVGFGKKPIVHMNPLSLHFIPEHAGLFFRNADDLKKLLQEAPPVSNESSRDFFWKQGCKENFLSFCKSKLISA